MNTKKIKDAVKEATVKTAETVGEVTAGLEKASKPVTNEIMDAAAKAEPVIRKAKDAAKKASAGAVDAAKKASTGAKAAGKKAQAMLKSEIYVESGERQFVCTDIEERCRADYKAAHKTAIRSCRIYIKPEDAAAYYVINGVEGKIEL